MGVAASPLNVGAEPDPQPVIFSLRDYGGVISFKPHPFNRTVPLNDSLPNRWPIVPWLHLPPASVGMLSRIKPLAMEYMLSPAKYSLTIR